MSSSALTAEGALLPLSKSFHRCSRLKNSPPLREKVSDSKAPPSLFLNQTLAEIDRENLFFDEDSGQFSQDQASCRNSVSHSSVGVSVVASALRAFRSKSQSPERLRIMRGPGIEVKLSMH